MNEEEIRRYDLWAEEKERELRRMQEEKLCPEARYSPQEMVASLIRRIGDDPNREGLKDTPNRVVKSWSELFSGYKQDITEVFHCFKDGACNELVLLRDVEFFSTCEHHMLPFYGTAHIAYIPKGVLIGVSKLSRLLDIFSKRLQIQERIAQQVTEALDHYLEPLGSACILSAKHLCMACRGVKKGTSRLITSSLTGVFMQKAEVRAELFALIGRL